MVVRCPFCREEIDYVEVECYEKCWMLYKVYPDKDFRPPHLRISLLLIPTFSKVGYSRGGRWESIYIRASYYSLLASAGLGLGRPEVKPSTSGPLPARLKELAGKPGWMKWEPNLAEGGCPSLQ